MRDGAHSTYGIQQMTTSCTALFVIWPLVLQLPCSVCKPPWIRSDGHFYSPITINLILKCVKRVNAVFKVTKILTDASTIIPIKGSSIVVIHFI